MVHSIKVGYLLVNNEAAELNECRFDLEDRLQEDVEKSIKILEKIFSTELLNCGKVSFSGGLEADLVLLSKEEHEDNTEYIPLVLELKRAENRESRREVLAQLLEYITLIYLEPQRVIGACQNNGVDFDVEVLKKNIKDRRIRGVIVSENITDILKNTIEFLNEELNNIEIFAIEFKKLCTRDKKYSVIIPILIGETTESERKRLRETKVFWTYEMLRRTYNETIENKVLRDRLLELLEWARQKELLAEYYSNKPRFRIFKSIITVEPSGILYVRFGRNNDSTLPKQKRQKLLEKLQELHMLPNDIEDADSVSDGRSTLRGIGDLTSEEFSLLKEIFEEIFLNNNPNDS